MIITASRPYFAPYPGFFYLVHLSDIFVILDDVQFPRGTTWITRNRFKNDQGTWWMTIPVWKKGRGLQDINDVRICREGRWAHKHRTGLRHAYANAPYLADHLQFLNNIFTSVSDRLIDFNLAIIHHLMLNLAVDTEIRRLSELNITLTGERLLIEICRYFNQQWVCSELDVQLRESSDFSVHGQVQHDVPDNCQIKIDQPVGNGSKYIV